MTPRWDRADTLLTGFVALELDVEGGGVGVVGGGVVGGAVVGGGLEVEVEVEVVAFLEALVSAQRELRL